MSKDIPVQQTEACMPAFRLGRNSLFRLTKTGKTTLQAIKVNIISNNILKLLAKCTQEKDVQSKTHFIPSVNLGKKKKIRHQNRTVLRFFSLLHHFQQTTTLYFVFHLLNRHPKKHFPPKRILSVIWILGKMLTIFHLSLH